MKNIIICLFLLSFSITATAQEIDPPPSLQHKGYLAFSLFDYLHWQGEHKGAVSLIGNYQVNFTHGHHFFTGAHELFAELGFQRFQGKAIYKYADNFYLDSKLSLSFAEKAAATLTSNVESQFLSSYEIGDSIGTTMKNLKSSFLTPAFWTLGGALSLMPKEGIALHLSMVSTKMTYLREQNLLNTDDGTDTYWEGLSIGKKLKFDLGLNLEIDFDQEISPSFFWQNRTTVFYDYVYQTISANTRNQFTFPITKSFKLMINTDLVYMPAQYARLQLRNEILMGVYF